MNESNFTRMMTFAVILFSFLAAGCAQVDSSGTMDKSMNTMMEESMNETGEKDMGTPMDAVKTETEGSMMGENEKKMNPGRDKMMK